MDMPATIRQAEARLAAAEIPVAAFCQQAGIHRATWQRWKAGVTAPSVVLWAKIEQALPVTKSAA